MKTGAEKVVSRLHGKEATAGDAPTLSAVTVQDTSLNATGLSRERRVAWKVLKLSRVKKIAKRHGCMVNDLALLLCSAALDQYYASSGEQADFDQVAVMPFNVRGSEYDSAGNAVTVRSVNLHNSEIDLAERLQAIAGDTRILKHEVRPEASGPVDSTELMAVFSPFLLESALRLVSRLDLMSRIKMGNTMISNVPGAPVPLYVAGAAVETVIPMAPVVEGMALSCTVASTHENLVIGFHCCGETVGDMGALMAGVEQAFKELA